MAKKKVFSIGTALSQGLEETIESAQNYSSELRIDIIPLRKIECDPSNPRNLAITMNEVVVGIGETDRDKARKIEELASLQSMAHSIKTQGLINPIIVYKHGDKYRLIAGERRTLASLLAGKSDIQAKILDDKPNELKISLLQWMENIERSDLTLWERMNNLKMIVHAYAKAHNKSEKQISITELSQLIGCVKSHAANYRTVLHADQELSQLIAEHKIKNLEKAALIADITDEALRQKAIDACVAGATLKQMKHIIDKDKIKPMVMREVERRGRQSTTIQFGFTKNIDVAKVIVGSLLSNKDLSHVTASVNKVDWTDHRSVTEIFKHLLKTLEKIHA